MPAGGKTTQSGSMLYAVITFVILFLISATFAVIFYIKSEEFKTQRDQAKADMERFASSKEQTDMTRIVGKTMKDQTVLGTLSTYIDKLIQTISGKVAPDTTAEMKFNESRTRVNETITSLGEDLSPMYSAEDVDLTQVIKDLKARLDIAKKENMQLGELKDKLQDDFDTASKENLFRENQFAGQRDTAIAERDKIQAKYNELEKMMKKSSDEQIKLYMDKLKNADKTLTEKNAQIDQLRGRLGETSDSLRKAITRLETIRPQPGADLAAFKSDARIVRVDLQTNLVYLDIGTDDGVYLGLTFQVYDKSLPIPEDGKGKAQIEVFHIEKNVSTARINSSSKKNPIVPDDIVANPVWDSKTPNQIMVTGDFDFDGDGNIDSDGATRIKELIEHWGAKVVDNITIDTDFVVIGTPPKELAGPKTEALELDPMLQKKYQESLQKKQAYDQVLEKAYFMHVPVFNQKRFMNLIGYETLAAKSKPK